MKYSKIINLKVVFAMSICMALVGCERDLSNDAEVAGFPKNGDVFIDAFSAGLDYFPFVGEGADPDAFSVVTDDVFSGTSAMRFDVPTFGNGFVGATFNTTGGRDLTGFDALTFYAKASQGVTLDNVGFGIEGDTNNQYQVTLEGLEISTNWKKFTVPIPDASKLVAETGLFWLAEGASTPEDEGGFILWMDEVKFEKLGTLAQPRPQIFNGNDEQTQTFIGANVQVVGLTQTLNSANGDITVTAAPSYFDYSSSNPSVATVNELGNVTVLGTGTAVITASLGGTDAAGSLTIESLGEFVAAPVPDEAPENVISIFSDAYTNVPVDYYNGYFAPFQTTQGQDDLSINGDNVINYTDLNFVGVGTFLNVQPINATGMTHFHVDINVRENVDPGDFIRLELLNGVQTANEISGQVTLSSNDLLSNDWVSLDIPLGDFNGLSVRDAIGLIFFVSDATISEIYVDNIYYYREVVDPSDNVDDSAATEVALPVGFESTSLTYGLTTFAGADSAVEPNPDQSGINPTSTILRTTKTNGAEFFAGTILALDSPVDFSTSQKFRMKVWSPKAGIPVRIKLENSANSAQFVELDANTTTTNEWEELEWDFSSSNFNVGPLDLVIIFFEFVPGVPGDGSVYYCDDLKILN